MNQIKKKMTTYIPSIPWERAGKEGDVIALIDKCMSDGYANRGRLFDLIAVHGSEWAMQSLPKQWSMRALAVVAYLDGLDLSKIPTKELPLILAASLQELRRSGATLHRRKISGPPAMLTNITSH